MKRTQRQRYRQPMCDSDWAEAYEEEFQRLKRLTKAQPQRTWRNPFTDMTEAEFADWCGGWVEH
jgi:transposase-like protein